MSECIQKVISSGFIPILLGGLPFCHKCRFDALYQATKGKIGIIDFDAHLDLKFDSPVQGKYSAAK